MRKLSCALCIAAGTVLAWSPAYAQDDNGTAAQAPAAATGPAEPAPTTGGDTVGTVIHGDRESPIGLYLTPWKNEHAERSLDRPPQFLEEEMTPIDPKVFRRQIEYYDTITAYRQAEMQYNNK